MEAIDLRRLREFCGLYYKFLLCLNCWVSLVAFCLQVCFLRSGFGGWWFCFECILEVDTMYCFVG